MYVRPYCEHLPSNGLHHPVQDVGNCGYHQQVVLFQKKKKKKKSCTLSDFSCSNIQVPESIWHVSWRNGGDSGLHWISVGRREQGLRQELQKEKPLSVCDHSDGHQLLSAVNVWRRLGLHLWNHLPFAV